MDPHVRWLRRKIVRWLVLRSVALALLVTAAAMAFLMTRTSRDPVAMLPWAVLLGQAAALGQLVIGLTTNPLSYRYLQRYIANPYNFGPTHPDGEPHEIAKELAASWQLDSSFTVHDAAADPPPVFDLLQSPNKVVTVAVGRATGTVAFLTQTKDGRIVHTDAFLVLPHKDLIVNRVGGDAQAMAKSHVQLVDALARRGVASVPAAPKIFVDAMVLERETYGDVGAFLGSFLNIEDVPAPHRPVLGLKAADLLGLSLDSLQSNATDEHQGKASTPVANNKTERAGHPSG